MAVVQSNAVSRIKDFSIRQFAGGGNAQKCVFSGRHGGYVSA